MGTTTATMTMCIIMGMTTIITKMITTTTAMITPTKRALPNISVSA